LFLDQPVTKMKPPKTFVMAMFSVLLAGSSAYSQTAAQPDLDRDGIPNISDRDVDNDGILNGSDRNIDGGIARSGPLRGRHVGDNLPNNSPLELDMDADGLADNAAAETDIDGDGLLDGERRETDLDGDGLADNAANETDIDGDGLLDSAVAETDIDGDGQTDGSRGEVDIDGDGSANGLDADIDGDGLANNSDTDIDGTSLEDATLDILYEVPGNPRAYANDAAAASIISFVDAELRKALQIPTTDTGLRVRVQINGGSVDQPAEWGGRITGVWRYFTSDRIQLWAKWCYPANDPSQLKIFVNYEYVGPYRNNPMDFAEPANYAVSEENRLHAGYSTTPGEFSLTRIASSPNVFIGWLPGQPVEFFYSAPNAQATGFAPPYDALRAALDGYPNFTSNVAYLDFSADLSTAVNFQGVQPILRLLRTIRQVNLNWYGQLEAQQLR
jgi:hypothetical protein